MNHTEFQIDPFCEAFGGIAGSNWVITVLTPVVIVTYMVKIKRSNYTTAKKCKHYFEQR